MDLKELLGEELYNQIVAKAGDKKLAVVNDGNWFPKEKFDEVNTAKKQAETDLKDRDTQLVDLKKSTGDNKALQDQITQLQTDNKTASDKYEADVKVLRINTALKLALASDTHDPDLVAGLLDRAKIELDESGNVKSGLDEQIKSLRESKAFLFAEKKEDKAPMFKGAKPPEGKEKESDPNDLGSNFAKEANSKGAPASKALNPWG
ncbi:hypothetical protein J2T13_003658 [Paenibacillus sp. DS2015]|uniref:phage scaffolding protein n=1 Tax=Paenibacillus sp. DS2015 TaxID=3373917 RepID=UPI003D1B89E5